MSRDREGISEIIEMLQQELLSRSNGNDFFLIVQKERKVKVSIWLAALCCNTALHVCVSVCICV